MTTLKDEIRDTLAELLDEAGHRPIANDERDEYLDYIMQSVTKWINK